MGHPNPDEGCMAVHMLTQCQCHFLIKCIRTSICQSGAHWGPDDAWYRRKMHGCLKSGFKFQKDHVLPFLLRILRKALVGSPQLADVTFAANTLQRRSRPWCFCVLSPQKLRCAYNSSNNTKVSSKASPGFSVLWKLSEVLALSLREKQ